MRLDRFEGPLDLLLDLIRRQKIDIFDIPIARLTAQYLAIIEQARRLDLDVAGDYLVMAATLMRIKARMLLPRPAPDGEEEAEDPRAELVAQLIAYEQFRDLAEKLDARPRVGRDLFPRGMHPEAAGVARPPPTADLDMLLAAFRRVLARIGGEARLRVVAETVSVRERMASILDRLARGPLPIEELWRERPTRAWIVATLLALLELWRRRAARLVQSEPYGDVLVIPAGGA